MGKNSGTTCKTHHPPKRLICPKLSQDRLEYEYFKIICRKEPAMHKCNTKSKARVHTCGPCARRRAPAAARRGGRPGTPRRAPAGTSPPRAPCCARPRCTATRTATSGRAPVSGREVAVSRRVVGGTFNNDVAQCFPISRRRASRG